MTIVCQGFVSTTIILFFYFPLPEISDLSLDFEQTLGDVQVTNAELSLQSATS
jgi:hypothetical protein